MRLKITTEAEYDRAVHHFRDVWRRERSRAGVSFEVVPFVEPMNSPQRGRLFGLIYDLALRSGSEPPYLRAYFENQFGPTLDNGDGALPKPMSDYSKDEASAMIERVIQVAADQGYQLR